MKPSEEGAFLKELYLRRYRPTRTRKIIIVLFFYALFQPLIYLSDKLWEIG